MTVHSIVELLPHPADNVARSRRKSMIITVLAAIAAVAVTIAAALFTVFSTEHPKTAAPPLSQPVAANFLHSSNVVLPRGVQDTRADIPWNQVGPGWTLAAWSPNPDQTADKVPMTIFLVNPQGGRYLVTTAPGSHSLQFWSPDHQRILLGDSVFDLVTGTTTPLRTGSDVTMLSFTADSKGFFGLLNKSEPDGTFLSSTLERFSLTGQVEATFPSQFAGVGKVNSYDIRALATPDGRSVVVGAEHGLAVLTINGKLVRAIAPSDAHGKPVSCQPVRLWSSSVVLATCSAGQGGGALWKIPLDGGAPTQFSGAGVMPYFAFIDAWPTSAGLMGLSEASCGPAFLVRFDAHMKPSMFTDSRPAGSGQGGQHYVAHDGNYITNVFQSGGCMSNVNTLGRTSAVTGKSVALLGPGMNGGNVVDALSPDHEILF